MILKKGYKQSAECGAVKVTHVHGMMSDRIYTHVDMGVKTQLAKQINNKKLHYCNINANNAMFETFKVTIVIAHSFIFLFSQLCQTLVQLPRRLLVVPLHDVAAADLVHDGVPVDCGSIWNTNINGISRPTPTI